jgi:hypothetical protein
LLIEELVRSGRRYISERRLVKQSRIHHALIGQMLDDHVDEFDLRRRRDTCRQESAEGFADRRAIKPHERANESAEALARFTRTLDISGLPDASIEQQLFEFAKSDGVSGLPCRSLCSTM